jgi:hypothetical protein
VARFTYIGPVDEVEVPLLGGIVLRHGDEFDVDDAHAQAFAEQPDNYSPVED